MISIRTLKKIHDKQSPFLRPRLGESIVQSIEGGFTIDENVLSHLLRPLKSFCGIILSKSCVVHRLSAEIHLNIRRSSNMSTALVILAPGAEEMEFVIAADVLRRAGITVTVAGLNGVDPVKCSRDVVIVPDSSLENVKSNKYDVVVLPGGLGGSKAMNASPLVGEILKQQEKEGRIIAAICAAPTALATFGIGTGKSLTSYPAFKSQLESQYKYVDDQNVVQDGNLITSRGPATAFAFGLKIAEVLSSPEKAAEVAKAMLL